MKSALETIVEIDNAYEKDPRGWTVLACMDKKSPNDKVYFFHHETCWVIMCPLFGLNGYGQRVKVEKEDELQKILKNPKIYGYHPMSERIIEMIMKGYEEKAREELKRVAPVTVSELKDTKPPGVSQGPIAFSRHPLGAVIPSQAELEAKMRKELKRLTEGMYL